MATVLVVINPVLAPPRGRLFSTQSTNKPTQQPVNARLPMARTGSQALASAAKSRAAERTGANRPIRAAGRCRASCAMRTCYQYWRASSPSDESPKTSIPTIVHRNVRNVGKVSKVRKVSIITRWQAAAPWRTAEDRFKLLTPPSQPKNLGSWEILRTP